MIDEPAISDTNRRANYTLELDVLFVSVLEYLYDAQPSLFPENVEGKEYIRGRYHCFRTWRKYQTPER